ncbi:MAG TPA: hypothetical protein VN026_12705 [Bacteroidia bacterium]|nr:hypothetical protein [Bacteroidia bacterium]
MKFTARLLAVVLIELTALNSQAQGSFDFGAVVPISNVAPKPIGFSLNMLSSSLIGNKSKASTHAEWRLGANIYLAGLDSRKIDDVPLLSPSKGMSKVNMGSRMFGCNFVSRFVFPGSKIIQPYTDMFFGMRDTYVHLDIRPHDLKQKTGSQFAGNFANWNYGMTAGLRFRIDKDCYADIGVVYSNTIGQGMMADIHSARVEGKDLVMDRINAPQDLFMLRTGIVFPVIYFNGNDYSHHHYYHSHCHFGGGSHISVHV